MIKNYGIFARFILLLLAFILGCKGKHSTNSNTSSSMMENIIKLDLSIQGSFGATYLYGPSILCNQSIITGSAKLSCSFTPPVDFPTSAITDAVYTTDLAASIADGCITTGISSTTKFIGTPFISAPCISGTLINCIAYGNDPTRSIENTVECP